MRRNPEPVGGECPCDSGLPLARCCGRYHDDGRAPAAEALMRSRYSAYVLGLEDYLLRTWHPSTRPASLDLQDGKVRTTWLGLKVLRSQSEADRAVVEFVARYKVGGGSARRLHETSRFVCEEGRWYYVDGDVADA